ncbi:MAG: helix-turn-helix transcriptional regulator [Thermoguttaceae bacterium]|jgi:DNA-binding XRE family transcriptional regulator
MTTQSLNLDGKSYVVLERTEYERLTTLAKAADLPPLPNPDRKGNYPAVEFGCATIARGIIRDRVKAGLNQKQLAKLAGIRVETLCRIETGRHLPSVPTIEKIDRVLKRALAKGRGLQ